MFAEICVSLSIFFISLYLYIHSTTIEAFGGYEEIGPEFWPQIILIGLMICSAILATRYLAQWFKGTDISESRATFGWVSFAIVFFSIIGYVLLWRIAGYIFLTPFLIISIMIVAGARRISTYIFTIAGVMLLTYFVFVRLLLIPLPRGQGIFRDISLFFGV